MKSRPPVFGCGTIALLLLIFLSAPAIGEEGPRLASFARFDEKAQNGEKVSVVFFGGSLTGGEGASHPDQTSFRALMETYLRDKYQTADFQFHNAAIAGTGSKLGMFRVDRDVLARKPDLVFVDFTIEDGLEGADRESLASYERILRELITEGIPVVQILAGTRDYFGADWKHLGPPRLRDHREMATLYKTAPGDSFPILQRFLTNEKRSKSSIWHEEGNYPHDAGHRFLFEAARSGLKQAISEKRICNLPRESVFAHQYRDTFQFFPTMFQLPLGWHRTPTLRSSFSPVKVSNDWMDEIAVFDVRDGGTVEPIQLKFHGTFIGILGEADRDGLEFKVIVDGEIMPFNIEEDAWPTSTASVGGGERFFWYEIADNLKPGRHTVEILPVIPLGQQKGQLRIESICVAGPGPDAPQSIAAGSAGF